MTARVMGGGACIKDKIKINIVLKMESILVCDILLANTPLLFFSYHRPSPFVLHNTDFELQQRQWTVSYRKSEPSCHSGERIFILQEFIWNVLKEYFSQMYALVFFDIVQQSSKTFFSLSLVLLAKIPLILKSQQKKVNF